jgi:hypothetical protein
MMTTHRRCGPYPSILSLLVGFADNFVAIDYEQTGNQLANPLKITALTPTQSGWHASCFLIVLSHG